MNLTGDIQVVGFAGLAQVAVDLSALQADKVVRRSCIVVSGTVKHKASAQALCGIPCDQSSAVFIGKLQGSLRLWLGIDAAGGIGRCIAADFAAADFRLEEAGQINTGAIGGGISGDFSADHGEIDLGRAAYSAYIDASAVSGAARLIA